MSAMNAVTALGRANATLATQGHLDVTRVAVVERAAKAEIGNRTAENPDAAGVVADGHGVLLKSP